MPKRKSNRIAVEEGFFWFFVHEDGSVNFFYEGIRRGKWKIKQKCV
jgi:hypothetical protein